MAVTLNTAGKVIHLTAESDTVAIGLILHAIKWSGAGDTDVVTLVDPVDGGVIWTETATADDFSLEAHPLEDAVLRNGVLVDTLDGGTVSLYYK